MNNRYFPISDDKFDHLAAISILRKQGYHVALNWSAKPVYPKASGKGAAKGIYPVIGLAILDREYFLSMYKNYHITDRFKTDSWFACLEIGTFEELKELISFGPNKREEKKEEEEEKKVIQPLLFT